MAKNDAFGRVVGTQHDPITPVSFPFWANDIDAEVEVGDIVCAEQFTKTENVKSVGIVDSLELFSDIRDALQAFFSHNLGDVRSEPPTERPMILKGNVAVVFRNDRRHRPIRHGSTVRHALREEIIQAYAGEISKEKQIIGGFTQDAAGNYIPIPINADFLLGPEAAHVNITGASGLATKTSYAIFLLRSILGWAETVNESIAVIAFNIKHDDLLWLDKTPRNLEAKLKERGQEKLFRATKENRIAIDSPVEVEYYCPQDRNRNPNSYRDFSNFPTTSLSTFSYGLSDLIDLGGWALLGILDPETIDEKVEALVFSVASEFEGTRISFNNLMEEINRRISGGTAQKRRSDWINIGGISHHVATVRKVLRDINAVVNHKLVGLLQADSPSGDPLPLKNIKSGDFWVVDVSKLNDNGQRLIFYRVLSHVEQKLAARSPGFPGKVIIFVDELNKFAPSGALRRLPLKSQVIDIASRGRSIGLILIGAEQFSSMIDDQVFGNSGTIVVGRSQAVELKNYNYAWMSEGFKKKCQALPKGYMLLKHAIHIQPALIHFPIPVQDLWKEEMKAEGKPIEASNTGSHIPTEERHSRETNVIPFKEGDLVVHLHRGVGRYVGEEERDGVRMFAIEYQDGKLFIPLNRQYLLKPFKEEKEGIGIDSLSKQDKTKNE